MVQKKAVHKYILLLRVEKPTGFTEARMLCFYKSLLLLITCCWCTAASLDLEKKCE